MLASTFGCQQPEGRSRVGTLSLCLESRDGCLLFVPRYFGDAKHGRVSKASSNPIYGGNSSSSSYNSLFFCFLTACLHLSPGNKSWGQR